MYFIHIIQAIILKSAASQNIASEIVEVRESAKAARNTNRTNASRYCKVCLYCTTVLYSSAYVLYEASCITVGCVYERS